MLLGLSGLFFTLTQGKLVRLTGAELFVPDLLAIETAYVFCLFGNMAACIFALWQGVFIDLFSGGMHGLFTLLYLSVFGGISFGSRFFNLQSPKGQFVILVIAVATKKIFLLSMLAAFSRHVIFPYSFWWAALGSILCTGLITPLLFCFLDYLKAVVFGPLHDTTKNQLQG